MSKKELLLKQALSALDDVEEAYETGLMSDAKTSVYQLLEEVKGSWRLGPILKIRLIRVLRKAWRSISGFGSTYSRAANATYWLYQAVKILQ